MDKLMRKCVTLHPGARRVSRGFSLLEMMAVLGVLGIVLSVVFEAMVQMQQRQSAENSKVDTVQETRDFIDQMVRDIHTVGYPPGRVQVGNPTCVGNVNVSCGLILFSNTQIQYEGDLDGTGTVYQVWMQLLPPASGSCPCTLQRGVVTKAQALAGQVPTYFAEVNGVLNSGNGAGVATYPVSLGGSYAIYSTADVFDAYDVNANPVASCGDPLSCSSVRSLQITANVAPNYADPQTKVYPVLSITSKARLNN
jgi:prepilin-type N-terminal cleavage/methylation domain-containing protein